MGESAPRRGPAGGCPCSPPGDTPRQPRPHPLLTKPSRAPSTATPDHNRPPPPRLSDRGARCTQSEDGGRRVPRRERSLQGSARARASYLPDFFFDL